MSVKKAISLLIVTAVILCSLPLVASAADALSSLIYEKSPNNNYIIITGCSNEAGGVLDIPSMIEGLPVEVIYDGAFTGCEYLTEVNIPETVEYVDESVFDGCIALKAVNVDADNKFYSSIDGVLFDKSQTSLFFCPTSKVGVYTIPASVTIIGQYAFEYCSELTDIVLHNNLTKIGYGAFINTQLYNNEDNWDDSGVLYLGNYLIEAHTSITGKYTVKDGTVLIANFAFSDCEELSGIKIPDSVRYIGTAAFINAAALSDIEVSDSVEMIGSDILFSSAYYNDESNWDDGVLYLGKYIVGSDSQKVSGDYNIKDGTICISDSAFYNCGGLAGVTIPDSVVYIGEYAFEYCYDLVSVEIPYSVRYIGYAAFCWCQSLSSVVIGNGVRYIGDAAFTDCALTQVTLPYGIDTIGYAAFGYVYNDSIEDVTLINDFLIKCYENSSAKQYAIDNGIDYEIIETKEFILFDEENCYINEQEGLLVVLADGITADEMLCKIGGGKVKVFTEDNPLEDSDLVKTGCTIRLMIAKTTVKELRVIIMGDVDCNGLVTVEDARYALRVAVGLENMSANPYGALAAKTEGSNGEIGVEDARTILRVAVRLESFLVPG